MTTLFVKGHAKKTFNVAGVELDFAYREGTSDLDVLDQVIQPYGTLYADRDTIESCDWWIDVGANIGAFAGVARTFGVNVLAVEPNVFNIPLLMQNTRDRSNTGNITFLPAAIGRHDSLGRMTESGELMHRRFDPQHGSHAWYTDPVPAVAMQRICWEMKLFSGSVGMKIDAEGAEWDIFDSLLRYGPPENLSTVIVEFHNPGPQQAVVADMEIQGFDSSEIENSNPGLEPDDVQIVRFDRT